MCSLNELPWHVSFNAIKTAVKNPIEAHPNEKKKIEIPILFIKQEFKRSYLEGSTGSVLTDSLTISIFV